MKNKFVKYALIIVLSVSQGIVAINYVDLGNYKSVRLPNKNKSTVIESFLKEEWNSFRASTNESFVSDNISSKQFWEILRNSLEEGTFYNRIANYQIQSKKTGGELFFETIFTSINQIPVIYKSVTPDGDSIWLSGKIFLPKNKKAKNIIIANHYTICANSEAPSNAPCIEGLFATKDYIVLMPDYIGYGVSSDWIHPYLHLNSTVSSAIDMLKAAIPYLQYNGYSYFPSLILIGYSQGAAATLALQRLLEEQYHDIFPIRKVYAGAGPYDLAGTYDYYISKDTMDIPCAMPMLLVGMNYGERLGLKQEDFFQPFLLQKYHELIEKKNTPMLKVNAQLGNNINLLFKPIISHTDSFPTSLLYQAVKRNTIIHWEPQSRMFLFHSTEDNMVPFLNSEHIKNEFDEQHCNFIQYDFAPYGNHLRAAVFFFEKVYRSL